MFAGRLGPGDVVVERYQLDRLVRRTPSTALWRARDLRSAGEVALKLLCATDDEAARRFAQEAAILDGLDALEIVRLVGAGTAADGPYLATPWIDGESLAARIAAGPLSVADAVAAAARIAAALAAVHAHDIVHRDLKPANVMLRGGDAAEAILLDFGIAQRGTAASHGVVGTPAYMSPEQCRSDAPVDTRSDLFALGAVLFECLTGRPPFTGASELAVIARIMFEDAPALAAIRPDVPAPLVALVARLLAKAPDQRPDAPAVAAILAAMQRAAPPAAPGAITTRERRLTALALGDARTDPDAAPVVRPAAADSAPIDGRLLGRAVPCVGRDAEIALLRAAIDAAFQDGAARACVVTAPPGAGKSRLRREVLARLAAHAPAAIWSAHGDAMAVSSPYALIAALVRGAAGIQAGEPAPISRGKLAALCRSADHADGPLLLGRLAALVGQPLDEDDDGAARHDPVRMAAALAWAWQELVARWCAAGPLLIAIDDLHWADPASAALLESALARRDDAPLCLIAMARPETGPVAYLAGVDGVLRIRLAPLRGPACRELVRHALGDDVDAALERELIELADGNPFFLEELIRASARAAPAGLPATVVAGVEARLQALAPGARRVLRAASVLGATFWEEGVAAMLGARDPAEVGAALRALVDAELISEPATSRLAGCRELRFAHVLLREGAYAMLPDDDRRAGHAVAARWLEAAGYDDAVVIAEHWLAAGDAAAVARVATVAAERARVPVVMRRTAELAAAALGLPGVGAADAHRLRLLRARMLAVSGHGVESGAAFLAAADGAAGLEAIDLRRRAAEQYLRAGHVEPGVAIIGDVLAAIGLRYPATSGEAALRLIAGRLRLRRRGLGFEPRAPAARAPAALLAIDAGHSVGAGLGMIDYVRGAAVQTHTALRALELGEPNRIARALAIEACFTADRAPRRSQVLLARAGALAQAGSVPHTRFLVAVVRVITDVFGGRYRDADRHSHAVEAMLTGGAIAGVPFEATTCRVFHGWAQAWLGALPALAARLPALIADCRARGDRFGSSLFETGVFSLVALAGDDPTSVRARAASAIAGWSTNAHYMQHTFHLFADVLADLYEGDAAAARARLARTWPAQRRSYVLRIVQYRTTAFDLRAKACLAAGGAGPLAEAGWYAGRVLADGQAWSRGLALTTLAAIAARRRGGALARRFLRDAIAGFDQTGLALHAAAARARLAELSRGAEADELQVASTATLTAAGIVRPDRFVALLAPW